MSKRTSRWLWFAVFVIGTGAQWTAAASEGTVVEVGIRGGAVVRVEPGAADITLAPAVGRPTLPAISPDGKLVAFEEDAGDALANLVIATIDGTRLKRVAIEPKEPNLSYSGMRYVEGIRWVSPDRVVVSGGINPSQSQYYVVDASAGTIVDDFVDDASAAAFTPDGLHHTTLTDAPHFALGSTPHLLLDDKPIYEFAEGTTLDGPPRFQPGGGAMAWVVRNDNNGAARLLVRRDSRIVGSRLPVQTGDPIELYWLGPTLHVLTRSGMLGTVGHWTLNEQPPALARGAGDDAYTRALALRASLMDKARREGIVQPDFWCASCGLQVLPSIPNPNF